ncbi:hypothetical protein HDK90DRAFT_194730 [Phyllosticta capitalensis]|uniref:Uncharacterized protein n=1 Tax=Phyllosticta capitalensis TaxID=121624 RepID=A0ABR1YX35_9PEZI
MNRYSRYDEDAYRLPEGMTRVGYDSDEQKYIFRDRSGQEWASRSGEAYGKLERSKSHSFPLRMASILSAESFTSIPFASLLSTSWRWHLQLNLQEISGTPFACTAQIVACQPLVRSAAVASFLPLPQNTTPVALL